MEESEFKSLCILGRQPALGTAELERLYGAGHIERRENVALLDMQPGDIEFTRLGGVIKVAKILTYIESVSWRKIEKYLLDAIPNHLSYLPDGQFTLGISAYDISITPGIINKSLMKIKKLIRETGRPVRVVPNKGLVLNSAQVLHNKLTTRGAWELLLVKDGTRTILAQTIFVQDIEAYGARDQARPKRDAKVGMLPPKLAQIMINLASPKPGTTILDPFCGTGVLLQESLLMGYNVIGSDIDKKMVESCRENLEWIKKKRKFEGKLISLDIADAATHKWKNKFDTLVSEIYLGRVFRENPTLSEIEKQSKLIDSLLKKFLLNVGSQIQKGMILCLALPAWQKSNGQLIHLSTLDNLLDLGYNPIVLKHVRPEDLVYYRPNQKVARRLVIMEKS